MQPTTPLAPAARMPVWAAGLIAVGGGFAAAAAFPRLGIWPLAFVGVAALSIAVEGRRSRTGAWLGFLHGLAFFGPLLHWTGIYVGAAPWLILACGEAGFFALLGAVLPVLQRLRGAAFWVAAAWVLEEFLRDRMPFGGFPWGRWAFSQSESPLRWFAALGGAPLVTFAVALIGGCIAVACRHITDVPRLSRPLVAIGGVLLVSLLCAGALSVNEHPGGQPLNVALIQGNVPSAGLTSEARAREVLDYHVRETMKLVAQVKAGTVAAPDLVLWPEDSSDVDPFSDAQAYAEIDATVKAVGAPILVGAILDAPDNKRFNTGILWSPTSGPGAQYSKRHPVPFGEYIPLRSIAEKISSATNLVERDMAAGHSNGLLFGAPVPLGDVICFEVAYDSLVRSSVMAGAQILVVQTNNATFGDTSETYQQLAMTKLRAVETGRTVLQVATTGKTAAISPNGKVLAESGDLFTADTISLPVHPRTARTLAVRTGPWPEYILTALGLLGIAWSVRGALTKRLRRGPGPEAEPTETVQKLVAT